MTEIKEIKEVNAESVDKNELQEIYKILGQRIRELRKERKLTLEDLAFGLGMDYSFLAKAETGKAVPSINALYRISKGLNVDFFQLFVKSANCGKGSDCDKDDKCCKSEKCDKSEKKEKCSKKKQK